MERPEKSAARLLIVDDEARQMKALCETLHAHGYETVGVGNGEAALAALRDGKYDLLLSDLNMGGMDGIALLQAALAIDPNIVGIIMTGQGSIATAVEAMKVGAFDYILKPFKMSVILPVLSRAMAMRQLRLDNAALQRRVRERTAQLEAANEELDSFASSVAHDLQAPARHVASFAELVLEEYAADLNPDAQRHLRTIANAAERMGRLISDLLAFSRLARTQLHRRPVNLDALVADVRHELEAMGDPAGSANGTRTFEWKISGLPTVQADESMLRQVFLNLISNAIKYTRGRNPAEIEIGCRGREADGFVLYVRDNGVGFDLRHADKLFGMFQRLHPVSDFEGNGIGLAHVRRIIQRHGGRIWADAAPGKGATFFFVLPDRS